MAQIMVESISKEPVSLKKTLSFNQKLKKIVLNSKCSKEDLILALSKIKNKKDIDKIKDKEVKKASEKVVFLAESYQTDGLSPITLGEILAKVIKLIANFTQSLIDFGKVWNKSISTTLEMGLNYAKMDAKSKSLEAVGMIVSGAVNCAAGVAILGFSAVYSVTALSKAADLDKITDAPIGKDIGDEVSGLSEKVEEEGGTEVDENEFAGEDIEMNEYSNGHHEEIREDDLEIQLTEKKMDEAVETTVSKKADKVDEIDEIEKKGKLKIKKAEDIHKTETDKKIAADAKRARYDAALKSIEKVMTVLNTVGNAIGGLIQGICKNSSAKSAARANELNAFRDAMSSRKNQNESLFRGTSSAIDSFLQLMQTINGYLRSNARN